MKKFFNTKLAVLALSVLMLLSLAACGGKSGSATEGPFATMQTTDIDGNKLDSSVFAENKLTLVNLWNLFCTPCVQEIPELEKVSQELADKGVGVMGLYYTFGEELTEDERTEIGQVLEKANATYTQFVASADMMTSKELKQIDAFPTTFFVDSQGNIVDSVMGSNDFEGWSKAIDKVLAKVESNG